MGCYSLKGRLLSTQPVALNPPLLQEFHVLCTFKRLSLVFYWPAMKKDVDAYVSSSKVFQKIRMIVGHPRDYSNHFLRRYKHGKIPLLTSLMAFLTLPEKNSIMDSGSFDKICPLHCIGMSILG
jgi:hypothetical protein